MQEVIENFSLLNRPRYMAFNSSEEVILTDIFRDVLILNKKGELLCSISRSEHGLKTICGVALDKDDNV